MLNTLKTALKENIAKSSQNIFLQSPLHCLPLKSKFSLAYLSFIKAEGRKSALWLFPQWNKYTSSRKQPRISCHKLSQLPQNGIFTFPSIPLMLPPASLLWQRIPQWQFQVCKRPARLQLSFCTSHFPWHTLTWISPLLSHKFSRN